VVPFDNNSFEPDTKAAPPGPEAPKTSFTDKFGTPSKLGKTRETTIGNDVFESLRNKLKLLEVKKMNSAGVTDHKGYIKAIKKATLKHRENEKKYPTVKDGKK
jgi:hypothetical protein